jgi:foldase protein PrsA
MKDQKPNGIEEGEEKEKEEEIIEETVETVIVEEGPTPKPRFSAPSRRALILVLFVLVLAVALYKNKGLFFAAMVNGRPITRFSEIQELEKRYGKTTLDSLITKALIQEEIQKQKVSISQKEIDDEIKRLEDMLSKQNQKLDDALLIEGITKTELISQIKTQKEIEKIIAKDIIVTDKEVTDYIASNSANTPKDIKVDDLKAQVRKSLQDQKMQERFQTWLDDLRKKAKIDYFLKF